MDETTPIAAPKARADDGTDSQAVYYGEGQSPKQVCIYRRLYFDNPDSLKL